MDSRGHARRPRRIVVSGPLAPFADGLRQDLAGQGFALDTVTNAAYAVEREIFRGARGLGDRGLGSPGGNFGRKSLTWGNTSRWVTAAPRLTRR